MATNLRPMSERARPARALASLALALALAGALALPAREARGSDLLRRRAFFGVRLAAMTADDRARAHLADSSAGVRIDGVMPGSTAEAEHLVAGDLLLAIDGVGVHQPAAVVAAIAKKKGGDPLPVTLVHEGRTERRTLRLKPLPLESGDGWDVTYASVESRGGRLRTIWTRPRTPGKHPALLLVQGIGTFSTENVGGGFDGYAAIIRDFTTHGFVTLRVDKPGCGDSEGGPLRDVDFDTQTDGFRQALLQLRADPGVDPDRIVIFGHSMGGVWAPLVAADAPVRGIAVYGTLTRTWLEYVLDNSRRQGALGGVSAAKIDSMVRDEAAASQYLYGEGLTPAEVIERHPALAAWFDSTFVQRTYYSGLHYTFVRQLAQKNLAAAWERFPGRVLALYGRSDFLSSEDDHRLIAQIVERAHPGHGTFEALDGVDHAFRTTASQAESFATWGRPGPPLDPRVAVKLREWAEQVVGTGGL